MGSGSNWFERNPRKTIAVVIILCFLILDIVAANVYKWVRGSSWAKSYRTTEQTYRVWSEQYHHDLAKCESIDNAHWGPYQYRVRTNSLGFKDRVAREVPLVSDHHRILFIGDSFTEGVGIGYEHTFVGIIDSTLSSRGIEVFNAGICGYSPIIYWRKVAYLIEEVGLQFDELVVYPDISDPLDEMRRGLDSSGNVYEFGTKTLAKNNGGVRFDDMEGREQFLTSQGLPKRFKEWFRDNTIVSFTAFKYLNMLYNIVTAQKGYAINTKATYWTMDDKLYREFGEEGLSRVEFYMERLYELLQEHNINLTVAVFPNPDQVYYGDLDSRWVRFWRDWCQRRQIGLINCFPSLVRGQTKEDRERMLDTYYMKGDFHFNEVGHRLIADVFLKYYTEN